MATYRKLNSGNWRAELAVDGTRDSGTFDTKAAAKAWADQRATELRTSAKTGIDTTRTVEQALHRYQLEVSPKKAGKRWEELRLNAAARVQLPAGSFGSLKLCKLSATHLAQYRDVRLQSVSGSTVNRELNLLSHVFSTARKEWRWIAESPTADVSRPKENAPRERRIAPEEIERICFALGFVDGEIAATKMARVGVAFLFAIETGMRAGEICRLERVKPKDHFERSWVQGTVAHLGKTKNGFARDVPLSPRALELIKLLPMTGPALFGIEEGGIDAIYRKARARTGLDDLHFHDTRHEAISRLAKLYPNVLDLARISGHRDLNQLQTYYHVDAAELARRLG